MYATAGPGGTRGAIGSAGQGISSNYVNYGAFNAATGAGAATSYDGRGINPYVYGPDGGGYGGSGGGYSGPTGETIVNYTYGENDAGPHAVTSRSNGDSFAYDDNGNMTSRTMDGVTWTQVFDAENRLIEVDDGTTETTYVYDAGGNRVKRIVDDGSTVTTTIYVAGMEIELEGSTETQRTIYYSGGAFRIIGGDDAGLYFRHGDHLGSTSVLSDSTGAKVEGSDVVYTPFGEIRTGELSDLTDFGFTGQILDRSSGDLMYYGARYYLPSLKRFISADTVTPSVLNAQALNRYSYVMNNPIKFTDPTGHEEHSAVYAGSCDLGCWIKRYEELVAKELIVEPTKEKPEGGGYNYSSQWIAAAIEESLKDYGVTVETVDGLHLTDAQKATMYANVAKAVWAMAVAANEYFTENGAPKSSMSDAFKDAYGDQHTITVDPATHPSNCTDQGGTEPNMSCNGGDIGGAKITISLHAVLGIADLGTTQMGDALQPEHLLVHEWGHNYSGPPPDGFNDHREIFDFIYHGDPDHPGRKGVGQTAWELFDIRFGDHNYENSEVTADAFTNWVFNSFLSSESQNVTNTWMCGVMEYTTGVGCQD